MNNRVGAFVAVGLVLAAAMFWFTRSSLAQAQAEREQAIAQEIAQRTQRLKYLQEELDALKAELGQNPSALNDTFNQMSGGKEVWLRTETPPQMQRLFDRIAAQVGATNGQITRQQYAAYLKNRVAQRQQRGERGAPLVNPQHWEYRILSVAQSDEQVNQ